MILCLHNSLLISCLEDHGRSSYLKAGGRCSVLSFLGMLYVCPPKAELPAVGGRFALCSLLALVGGENSGAIEGGGGQKGHQTVSMAFA